MRRARHNRGTNLADYFDGHHMNYEALTFSSVEAALRAHETDRCDAMTTERLSLAGHMRVLNHPEDHQILAEMISKEPTAALVRQGDDRWRDIAVWSFNVTLAAEELGITQSNVDAMLAGSDSAEVRRLLGLEGDFGKALGVGNDWAYKIIKLVGNYQDIWEPALHTIRSTAWYERTVDRRRPAFGATVSLMISETRKPARIFYGWWMVAACVVCLSTSPGQFVYGSLGLFVIPFSNEFGWDRAEISLALTLFTMSLAMAMPVLGHYADRSAPGE